MLYFFYLRIFENCGYPNDTKYIFLGNYTEQQRSLETFAFLLACKLKFPNQIFLLRGQQEDTAFIEDGVFEEEMGELYSENIWKRVGRVFEAMPLGKRKFFASNFDGIFLFLQKNIYNTVLTAGSKS